MLSTTQTLYSKNTQPLKAEEYRVQLLGIRKSFGGVRALRDVTLKVRAGEIHALVGENGAGKSTLMKILSGVEQPDAGQVVLDGHPVRLMGPHDALAHGVGIIHQELSVIPALTVAENIFLKKLQRKGWVPWKALFKEADAVLKSLGFDVDPKACVEDLSVAYRQMVEIARALSEDAEVLILDEPTAVLAPAEAERLFAVLDMLKARGTSIIYISHRLEEIFRIADHITVMRDGEVTGHAKPSDISTDALIDLMVGRKVAQLFPKRQAVLGEEVLRVEGLSWGRKVRGVSFALRKGEVLGVAGLVGSGRTEMAQLLFGVEQKDAGEVWLDGKPMHARSPYDAVSQGFGLVPEDRKAQGVILSMAVQQNCSLASLGQVSLLGSWLKLGEEKAMAERLVRDLAVKTAGVRTHVGTLSGGNQQKVAVAKWLPRGCKVLVLDEPTRGVDVGAKSELYAVINKLAEQGLGVLVISSDLMEVIGLCDRVMVMRQGGVAGFVQREELSEQNIMKLAVSEG
jgi:ribose transport system ATP-binding protein